MIVLAYVHFSSPTSEPHVESLLCSSWLRWSRAVSAIIPFMDQEFIARPSPVAYDEEFGTSVALSGGIAIIGAINDAPGPGAAYIFSVGGTGTTQRAKLTPSDSRVFDHFGRSVGIDGNYAVVGAPGAGAQGKGQAYIFAWDGTSWNEQALLTASDGSPSGEFGYAVAIHADTAIVGANNGD